MMRSIEDSQRYLADQLGYTFQDLALLQQALTHRSYDPQNNERLEFLGDAVLGMVIAECLYECYPNAKEGQLSRLRSSLVKGKTLAELAREFDLGQVLLLGQGELKAGGFNRQSILENAFEAIVGAMFLDSDFDTCRKSIRRWYQGLLENLSITQVVRDAKSELQEWLQQRGFKLPNYDVMMVTGADHCQTFHVKCVVQERDHETVATGSTRKGAEQAAAEMMLTWLIDDTKDIDE